MVSYSLVFTWILLVAVTFLVHVVHFVLFPADFVRPEEGHQ